MKDTILPASESQYPDPYHLDPAAIASAERERAKSTMVKDRLLGIILLTTCILLVSNSVTLSNMLQDAHGEQVRDAARLSIVAFFLNLALLFIGWRRYREMQQKITSYVKAERRAQRLAVTDPLTNFYNRRAIVDLTQQLIEQAAQKKQAVAFLLIDIDNFKQVNDAHGHSAGDFLLCKFAERVRAVAPKRAYLARLGGDEFAFSFAFYPDLPQEATRFATDIVEAMQRPFLKDGIAIDATVSVGIARHDNNGHNVSELMRRADIAMYEAKRAGKNSICWFDEQMEEQLRRRTALENAIRRGIETQEFVPYFEPIVDMKSGAITGFEMLARWTNPDHRHVSPIEFISVAAEIGMIDALTASIVGKALAEAREWDASLNLSINISPTQLLDERIAQLLMKLIATSGFPPQRLEIEVTEGAIFKNVALAKAIIHSLKNQGMRVAYDDFGTGYSSLNHLRELPFDRVKIDRSYISCVREDEDCAALVRAIASLCASLRLPVTAEGIENEAIHDFMMQVGDLSGQGYFYGRPLSAGDTRRFLAKRNLLPARRNGAAEHCLPFPVATRPIDLPTRAAS